MVVLIAVGIKTCATIQRINPADEPHFFQRGEGSVYRIVRGCWQPFPYLFEDGFCIGVLICPGDLPKNFHALMRHAQACGPADVLKLFKSAFRFNWINEWHFRFLFPGVDGLVSSGFEKRESLSTHV